MKKYPVVTLCGSTRFEEAFQHVQKDLTLRGNIVISTGVFGHSRDDEVREGMNGGTKTDTEMMLFDMDRRKIDMSDSIFIVNPDGNIGESTWSDICYARMLDKQIDSLSGISEREIENRVQEHIKIAEELAWEQIDSIRHS
ncbi:MAG: hypothetical protein PHX08_22035, partial [Lachnospiraceae bacterium]|nr:hypothetical protein [Lachnospiraceae bacterium]